MKKSTNCLLAALVTLLFYPGATWAQANLQPAKVATLAGDTLRGFIDYRGWDNSPLVITFRAALQAPDQTFRPLDIKGFRVGGDQYVSGTVAVDTSSNALETLTMTPVPLLRTKNLFLKVLVAGSKGLFRYKSDENSRTYFYIGQPGSLDLLVYKRFKPRSVGAVVVQHNNQYRQQLDQYLAACPAVAARALTVDYYAGALQRLFADYYATCASTESVVVARSKRPKQFGAFLGLTRTTLGFSNPQSLIYPVLDRYTQMAPTGGLYLNVPLLSNLSQITSYNEVLFTSFKGSGTTTTTNSLTGATTTTSIALATTYLKLNAMLRYTRAVGPGTWFLNGGFSYGYAMSVQNEKTVTTKFSSTERTTTGEAFPGLRLHEQGLVGGIGGSVLRLSAELRVEASNGFLNYSELSANFRRYSLLVGYRLH